MDAVAVEIVRFISDSFPGFVECRLVDAFGNEWLFHDKVPIVTLDWLDANSHYPQPGVIVCEIVSRNIAPGQRPTVVIDTTRPIHIESTTGDTRFEVFAEQLTEINWGSQP